MLTRSEYTIDDWLELHGFTADEVLGYCDFVTKPHQSDAEFSAFCDNRSVLNLLLEESLEHLVRPSLKGMLKGAENLDSILSTVRVNQYQPGEIDLPYTDWCADENKPAVHLIWSGQPEDLICLAHEMGHAAQMNLSQNSFMPPVAREVCAFLGELALIQFAREQSDVLHAELCTVWQKENQRYLKADVLALADSVKDVTSSYSYRQNYPLARVISMHMFATVSQSGIGNFFASGSAAMTHLNLPGVFGNEHLSHTGNMRNSQSVWESIASIYTDTLLLRGKNIAQSENAIRMDFSPQNLPDMTELFCYNNFPVYIRGHFEKTVKGILPVTSAFVGILSVLDSPHTGWLENASEYAVRQKIPSSLSIAEEEALSLCLSLSTDALYEVITGQLDPAWLSKRANVKCVCDDNRVSDPDDIPPRVWNKWRSLGVIALAALGRDEADITPGEFLEAFEEAASRDPIHNFSVLWPWAQPRKFDGLTALGMTIQQLASSSYHKQFKLSYYLPTEILPPMSKEQFTCYTSTSGLPLGLVSWAWITESVRDELHESGRALEEQEWKEGEHLFFNDWITDKKTLRPAILYLKGLFPNEIASSLRRNPDSSVRRVNKWVGRYRQKQ